MEDAMEHGDLKFLHQKLLEMVNDLDVFCKANGIHFVLSGGNVIGAVRHKGFIPWDDDLDIQMLREDYDKFLSLFKNNEKYYLQKDTVDYPLQFSKFRANNTTYIENIPLNKKYKHSHQGIFIDIFPVDKVSKNKLQAKKQALFSNILLSQSLLLRGYPKNHRTFAKTLAMGISVLFLPLRRYFYNYVKSFNAYDDFSFYCSFYGTTKKVYQDRSNFLKPYNRLPFENLQLPVMHNYKNYLKAAYGDYMRLPSEAERDYAIHAKHFSTTEDYSAYLEE